MEWILLIFLFVAALFIATGASIVGIGGSFLVITLLLLMGFPSHTVVGTSVASGMFTSLSAFLEFSRQKRIDWKLGLASELTTVPGAVIGSIMIIFVDSSTLKLLFSGLLITIAFFMWREVTPGTESKPHKWLPWHRVIIDRDNIKFEHEVDMLLLLIGGFFIGFVAGFFGISGGILKLPLLSTCGLYIHVASGTCSFMATITSAAAFISHALLGHVDYLLLIALAPGAIIGGQIGSRIAPRQKPVFIRRFFSVLAVLFALVIAFTWAFMT